MTGENVNVAGGHLAFSGGKILRRFVIVKVTNDQRQHGESNSRQKGLRSFLTGALMATE
jgi:hypothetical protein